MRISFRTITVIAWAALAAAAGALSLGWLSLSTLKAPTLCLFKLLTGIPCPGCGITHALLAAFRGQWAASAAYHPLGLPFLALWTAWLLSSRKELPAMRPAIGTALMVLVLGTYGLSFVG